MSLLNELSPLIQLDLNDHFVGEFLGRGVYRAVYVYRPNPKFVVKLEMTDAKWFANISEWQIWNEVKNTKWAKWFAPCISISVNGTVLVQERTYEVKKIPKRIPDFLGDTKLGNWGLFKGRPVMHDYGNHGLYNLGLSCAKLTDSSRRNNSSDIAS